MKSLKYLFIVAMAFFASCSSDSNEEVPVVNEVEGLTKLTEITNETHIVEVYKQKGAYVVGYNELLLRIRDKVTNQYVKNAEITWMPVMHMTSKTHSCPKSEVVKQSGKESLFGGYIVFQMASNTTEYWNLKFDYAINGIDYSANSNIVVENSAKRTLNVFTGADGSRYLVAYVESGDPKVALNDMKALVFKPKDMMMMDFPAVDNYKIKIDPRMPSMGNHGSPNNVDLTQAQAGGYYCGKLSLTMTGYWKINLQLLNDKGEVLKGEAVSDTVEASSIYFEIEF